jgi:hypothetical protein
MARKHYKDYPDNYFKMLDNFTTSGEDVILDLKYSEAVYTRHDLHRFFKALSFASESDPYAAKLSNITRDIVLVIEPPHAVREAPARLCIKMNPMAKMLMKSRPAKSTDG